MTRRALSLAFSLLLAVGALSPAAALVCQDYGLAMAPANCCCAGAPEMPGCDASRMEKRCCDVDILVTLRASELDPAVKPSPSAAGPGPESTLPTAFPVYLSRLLSSQAAVPVPPASPRFSPPLYLLNSVLLI